MSAHISSQYATINHLKLYGNQCAMNCAKHSKQLADVKWNILIRTPLTEDGL